PARIISSALEQIARKKRSKYLFHLLGPPKTSNSRDHPHPKQVNTLAHHQPLTQYTHLPPIMSQQHPAYFRQPIQALPPHHRGGMGAAPPTPRRGPGPMVNPAAPHGAPVGVPHQQLHQQQTANARER